MLILIARISRVIYFFFLIDLIPNIAQKFQIIYTDHLLFGKIVGVAKESSKVFSRFNPEDRFRKSSDPTTPLVFIDHADPFSAF